MGKVFKFTKKLVADVQRHANKLGGGRVVVAASQRTDGNKTDFNVLSLSDDHEYSDKVWLKELYGSSVSLSDDGAAKIEFAFYEWDWDLDGGPGDLLDHFTLNFKQDGRKVVILEQ